MAMLGVVTFASIGLLVAAGAKPDSCEGSCRLGSSLLAMKNKVSKSNVNLVMETEEVSGSIVDLDTETEEQVVHDTGAIQRLLSEPVGTPKMEPSLLAAPQGVSFPCRPPEASEYLLISRVDIPRSQSDWDTSSHIPYTVKNAVPSSFQRVAYCVKLGDEWVWTSFDHTDPNKIGVPVDYLMDSSVSNMNVFSNVLDVANREAVTGKVEFWDHCYGKHGGDNAQYDHDDDPYTENCWGSMQVHYGTQTQFGFNGFSTGSSCSVTIGNSRTGNSDGTFNDACNTYHGDGVSSIRTYVKIKPTTQAPTPAPTGTVVADSPPECTQLVAVSSTTRANARFWNVWCQKMPANTGVIRVDMGVVRDYYKPMDGETWCDMLVSQNLFEWSSNGIDWETPAYETYDAFGGSGQFWPAQNQAHPDDQRKFLSFWGHKHRKGGCCKTNYNSDSGDWEQSFIMYTCQAGR